MQQELDGGAARAKDQQPASTVLPDKLPSGLNCSVVGLDQHGPNCVRPCTQFTVFVPFLDRLRNYTPAQLWLPPPGIALAPTWQTPLAQIVHILERVSRQQLVRMQQDRRTRVSDLSSPPH